MNPQLEAKKLLEELGINTLPIIPKDICQQVGIFYKEDTFKGFDGMLAVDPHLRWTYIAVNSAIRASGRKNFTCAHELGHLCLDLDKQTEFICSRGMIESYHDQIPTMELSANIFAAELLMPKLLYQKMVDERKPGWDSIKELASTSQTSLIANARRFVDLTEHSCVLIVSKGGGIYWFYKSKEFAPHVQMEARTIPAYTHAYSASIGKTPPDQFEVVKADNWISGRGVGPYTEILEWTLPKNSYDQILTLLWDEEGIQGWEETGFEDDEDYEVEWDPPTFHKSKRKK